MPVVKAHREAPTIHFKADVSAVERTVTTASLAAKHEPETAMEAEVAALLQAAGAQTAAAVAEAEEALAMKALTVGEAKERREKLAKMRALMFYHEMKAKRLKKIKSKEYRRRLKKAEKRKTEAVAGEGGADLLLDDDELRHAQEEAEFNRAQERLTLKHKNTSRFIRRALRRGGAGPMDEGTKQAVAEQLRLGEELRKKVHTMNARGGGGSSDTDVSDDTSASEDDEEHNTGGRNGQLSSKAKAAALEILNGRGAEAGGPEVPTEGLFALPFMQRAMERRRAHAAEEARELLDMDNDGLDGNNNNAYNSAHVSSGRIAFRGTGQAEKLAERVRQLEAAVLASDSEAEGEREDVEAKAERLGKKVVGGDNGEEEDDDDDDLASRGKSGVLKKLSSYQGKISAQDRLFNNSAAAAAIGEVAVDAAIASGTGIEVSVGPRPFSKKNEKKRALEENSQGQQRVDIFKSSKKFQGAKPGYVFKKGPKGVGYYQDSKTTSNGASKQAKNNGNNAKTKPAAVSMSDEEADEEGSMRPSEKSSFGNTNNRKTAAASAMELTQEDLVRRAFAGDDVVSEFSKEKLAEVEEELPKEEIPGAVPGWGTWANAKREPRWAVEAKAKAAARKEAAAASREDAALQYVVISEKWDKKNAKYRTPEVPFPFNSKETYERAMRQPLGRDFNTAAAFRNLTRPEVVKDAGVIIQPVRFSAAMAEHAKQGETTKGSKRPSVLTVEGGMPKKQKLQKNKGGQKGKRRGLGE
jgi:U3 small nucleolar RNA-associated protein 14